MALEIYRKLAWLNELPAADAEVVLSECSGSTAWAKRMAAARPFPSLENLFASASEVTSAVILNGPSTKSETPVSPAVADLIEQRLIDLLER